MMKGQFGIRTKLLGLCMALSLMTVAVGAIGYFFSQKVEDNFRFIANKRVPKLELAGEMFLNYQQVRISLRTLGLPGLTPQNSEAAVQGTLEAIKSYEKSREAYVNLGFEEHQRELFEATDRAWEDFRHVGQQVLKLSQNPNPENQRKILEIFLHDCPEKAKTYSATIEALNAFHKQTIEGSTGDAEIQARDSTLYTWVVTLFAIIFGLVTGLVISTTTSNELKSISMDLIGNANEVSGTVSDLAASSEAISSAASDQASAIQETAASIEEIRAMVQRNAESSEQSALVSSQSRDEASVGKNSVNDMISAMRDIDNSNQKIQKEVQSGNQRIADIVKIIQEIESKTKVINEIVFQTKLLSFNASVEAARAGEHGKGFAVVAEEVGNLANMSGTAATEISTLLSKSTAKVNEIVQETTSSVQTLMKEARNKVERGSQVAEVCGQVLEKIVANADHLSQMVESISAASKEQSAGVDEIARAIRQLDIATQTNVAETQNTAKSAAHLGGQVKSLNGSSYRLRTLIEGGGKNGSGTVVNTFVWKSQYSLGITEMDDEHKVLIAKINALALGINQGKTKPALISLFEDLAKYTKEHFADEEAYLAKIRYPELENHKIIHRKLLSQLAEYEENMAKGQFDSGALITFLNDWLIKHIMGVDMKYSRFSKTGSTSRSGQKAA